MADVDDVATDRELADTASAIRAASALAGKREVEATGRCLSCGTKIKNPRRWCDKDCLEDWELAQQAKRRNG